MERGTKISLTPFFKQLHVLQKFLNFECFSSISLSSPMSLVFFICLFSPRPLLFNVRRSIFGLCSSHCLNRNPLFLRPPKRITLLTSKVDLTQEYPSGVVHIYIYI